MAEQEGDRHPEAETGGEAEPPQKQRGGAQTLAPPPRGGSSPSWGARRPNGERHYSRHSGNSQGTTTRTGGTTAMHTQAGG